MERVGEIQLTSRKPAQTLTVRPPAAHLKRCLELLLGLGEMRQTTLSEETQTVYTAALAQYDPRHVETVVTRLGRTKRAEFEKAIPELGDLEAMVKQEERKSRPPVVYCGQCINGVILVNARGQKWSYSIDGPEKFAKTCPCVKAQVTA